MVPSESDEERLLRRSHKGLGDRFHSAPTYLPNTPNPSHTIFNLLQNPLTQTSSHALSIQILSGEPLREPLLRTPLHRTNLISRPLPRRAHHRARQHRRLLHGGDAEAHRGGQMHQHATKCKACDKTVYLVDQLTADEIVFHKSCLSAIIAKEPSR
ncbi:uncharacterized protein LOC121997127 [Zingiber officinale]|uniref:uncharacterized protein LOC121997127 n=1 Tax=Zingiber officinale TaxID=94328 RepID=UPI001C4A9096|nr:uncharacterized protein LOC121997127 [Zingiber officinale]